MTKFNCQKTELVCNMGGYYGYEKETTYRKYFEDTMKISFENTTFSVIKEYDTYLEGVYGDYMKLPPEEKRRTHGFKCLDFGPYTDWLEWGVWDGNWNLINLIIIGISNDLAEQGLIEGEEKKLLDLIAKKLEKGKSIAQIADECEETEERIQELIKKL